MRATAAAERLAALVAGAAAAGPQAEAAEEARRLMAAMGTDEEALGRFFERLATELDARGVALPPIEQLPPSVVPLLMGVGEALAPGADGAIDFEAAAERLDAAVGAHLGVSPRAAREAAQRDRMRQEIADSVAASMRRHGLTPARDMPDDSDDADD